jgi:hypothetical protein
MSSSLTFRASKFRAFLDCLRPTALRATWIVAAFLLALLSFACPRIALAQETYCPQTISVDQKIDKVPGGWAASPDRSATTMLAGVTFFSGPPAQNASLKYDRWTERNGLAYALWRFQPKSSDGIWLSCRYSSTSMVLTKQLPAGTSECTVIYDPKVQISGLPEIRKITCH